MLTHNGLTFGAKDAKADLVFSYYNAIISSAQISVVHRIDL